MKAKDNFRTTCLIESSYQYIKKDTRKNADYNHENSMKHFSYVSLAFTWGIAYSIA